MEYVTEEETADTVRAVRDLSGLGPEEPENGPPPVRENGKDFPEIRLHYVREKEPEMERPLEAERNSGTGFLEVRLDFVRSGPPEPLPEPCSPLEKIGQVSREFSAPRKRGGVEGASLPKAQNLPDELQKPLQDVGTPFAKECGKRSGRGWRKSAGRPSPHEMKSEFRETAHEAKSEPQAKTEPEAHETESEFREAAHEAKSEPRAKTEPEAHETESEFPVEFVEARETPDVEALTRGLLEGLRLAAGAR